MAKQNSSRDYAVALSLVVVLSCGGGTGGKERSDADESPPPGGQPQSSDLHTAAVNGGIEDVKRLIFQGADVNAKMSDGATPLHWTAWAGKMIAFSPKNLSPQGGVGGGSTDEFKDHGVVAEFLIKNGADANAKDGVNSTPLHAAAFHGNLPVARVLIDHGADVNARRADGATPLSLSITSGHIEMTNLLQAHGAKVGPGGSSGSSRRLPPASPQGEPQWPSVDTVRTDIQSCERAYNRDLCRKAFFHFDRMLESEGGTDRERASAYAARARILSNSFEQHDKAILDYGRAIDLNPTSSEFYFNRGNTYLRLSSNERAVADYDEAIRLDPKNFDAYGSRGWAYHLMGINDMALQDYNYLLDRRPADVRGLVNRAAVYKDLGRIMEAVNDLKGAYRIQPGNPHIISELEELGEGTWLQTQ